MPRKDGLDTNQEMLADLHARGHEIFVAAYEAEFENELPDGFADKPLNALLLFVTQRTIDIPSQERDSIRHQDLEVGLLAGHHVRSMRNHLTLRHRPEDVHAHYDNVAKTIGGITLSHGLDMRRLLPVEGVIVDYTAYFTDDLSGRTRHVGTLKDKPTKYTLALAKTFAAEVDGYVSSEEFGSIYRFDDPAARFSNMDHLFTLSMHADLGPMLNGHEPKSWLNIYANTMLNLATATGLRLESLQAMHAPSYIVDEVKERYEKALAAYKRAEELITR